MALNAGKTNLALSKMADAIILLREQQNRTDRKTFKLDAQTLVNLSGVTGSAANRVGRVALKELRETVVAKVKQNATVGVDPDWGCGLYYSGYCPAGGRMSAYRAEFMIPPSLLPVQTVNGVR